MDAADGTDRNRYQPYDQVSPYSDPYAKFPGSFIAFPNSSYGRAIAWWLDHPFQPVPVDVFFPPATRSDPLIAGSVSHLDKLTFRAFLPLLNGLVGGGVWTLTGANHVATVASFFLLYVITRRTTGDPAVATLLVWAWAASWAGSWGFNDLVCGDAVAICLILTTLAVSRPWLIILLFIAASFTDERVIFAAPLLILFRRWLVVPPFSVTLGRGVGTRWAGLPVLIGVGGYAAARLFLSVTLNVQTGTSMLATPEIALYHVFVSYPARIFDVFEFLWIFPLGLLLSLGLTPGAPRRAGVTFLIACCIAATPALLVWDITRSLCYLLPGVLAGVCFFPGDTDWRRKWLLLAGLASLTWIEIYGSVFRRMIL